jgi:hypothetical protein
MKKYSLIAFSFGILLSATPANLAMADEKVVISDKDCVRALRAHRRQSADYVPGVDVYGRKVKSANLDDSGQIKVPDELTFDISPRIYDLIGLKVPKGLADTAVTVGTIKVRKSGAVYFNGKRLNNRTRSEIVELCKARMAEQ